MGLFPEASNSVGGTTGTNDTASGSTPNVRRRLFSAASEILAAVGKSSSGSVGGCTPKVSDIKTSSPPITKTLATVSFGGVTTTTTTTSSSSSMQQLSTSWEFLRPLELQDAGEKEEPHDMAPPRFIEVQKGKISLAPVTVKQAFEPAKNKEVLEARIFELEEALARLHKQVSQCGSPTLEKDLREQLESMNRAMKVKERRAMQVCRDHKTLQARFARQDNCIQFLSTENKNLHQRIHQYECCLDDVMRKVVDAIVAEDNLREEVTMLKNRVRDLEAQNAALSSSTSPAKGRDEGYCTMSSGQPPPSTDGHLMEDLPEEPEQMYMLAEPCSAEMEDWSMSQEELGAALEEDTNEPDWLWNSSSFLNSTVDSQSESISQLLQDTIEYSDDEEIGCKSFTRDFYKLVNIASDSTRSLQSPYHGLASGLSAGGCGQRDGDETDDTDESSSRTERMGGCSPTPSEAGLALVSSCSSSDTSDELHLDDSVVIVDIKPPPRTDSLLQDVLVMRHSNSKGAGGLQRGLSNYSCSSSSSTGASSGNRIVPNTTTTEVTRRTPSSKVHGASNCSGGGSTFGTTQSMPSQNWQRSNGWRRVSSHQEIIESASNIATKKDLKMPPPVPTRRSYAS